MASGIKRLQQEVQDLSHFASEKKGDKYELPSHIGILAEFTEVSTSCPLILEYWPSSLR